MTSTQQRHPWRATVRTVLEATLALAVAAPLIVAAVTNESPEQATGAVATFLAVAAAITRLFALPSVTAFLERFVPWLAPQPRQIEAPPFDE